MPPEPIATEIWRPTCAVVCSLPLAWRSGASLCGQLGRAQCPCLADNGAVVQGMTTGRRDG